jgi:hypothetical protein
MKIKELTVGDIASCSMLYYDASQEIACHAVCDYLQIDNLPIIGSFEYAERSNGEFEIKPVKSANSVNPYVRLLDLDLQDKLINSPHNVLFVDDGGFVSGVLHISDFNRNRVIQAIQHDMLVFERSLRQFLLLNRVSNDDLVGFMKQKAGNREKREERYWGNQYDFFDSILKGKGRISGPPLQSFMLSHLLDYSNSSISGKLFKTSLSVCLSDGKNHDARSIINKLRNDAMHAKDLIDKHHGLDLYSVNDIIDFYKRINVFIKYNEILQVQILKHDSHIRAVSLDNESKLKIIQFQYPNAIDYFLK